MITSTLTLRDRVQAAIPGYAESAAIVANANGVRPTPPASTITAELNALNVKIRERLLTGDPIPRDIADALLAVEDEKRRADAVLTAFDGIVTIARQNLEFLRSSPGPEAFEVLSTELTDVIERVNEILPALDGASSANDVVSRGGRAIEAWGMLQDAAERYDEIRSLQREFVPVELNFWDRFLTVGLYRDALHVHPDFARRRAASALARSGEVHRAPRTGLPLSGEQSWWPSDVDRPTALLRIVTTATPWVPAPEVMETAWSLALAASANLGPTNGGTGVDDRVIAQMKKNTAAYDDFVSRQ